MWRAYGGNSGVAIVLKNRPFITPNDKLGANTYPVYYLSKSDFANLFDKLVDNIIRNIQTIRNNNAFLTDLWLQLQSLQFCIKHPGFGEEKEWRVVYRPKYNPTEHIPGEIRSVRGTPQQIYTLRLEDIPEADFFHATPGQFIDRIIIGPCAYPSVARDAFVRTLEKALVQEADSKVIISDLPLRTYF